MIHITKALKKRFWSKVKRPRTGGQCWLWKAGTASHGYGDFYLTPNTHMPAHRIAWILSRKKEIPKINCICHICDVKLCVNPRHLYLGTASSNMFDSWKRGTRSHVSFLRGEKHPLNKLSYEEVKYIRKVIESKTLVKILLAAKFKVSLSLIDKIISRKNWKHV